VRPVKPWMLIAAWILGAMTFAQTTSVPSFDFPWPISFQFFTAKATAATYVYEKDTTKIPNEVESALNKLNRDNKIIATVFEQDTTDGNGKTPLQYVVALDAFKTAGGAPVLVVQAGQRVLKVVKDPKTEADVMGAVK
jgi:hypothetical protein